MKREQFIKTHSFIIAELTVNGFVTIGEDDKYNVDTIEVIIKEGEFIGSGKIFELLLDLGFKVTEINTFDNTTKVFFNL
jgi:hypothetical protein